MRIIEFISRWLGILAVIFIIAMMLSTIADVSGRYLFNSPIVGTVELNRTLLVYVVFLTLAYAQLKQKHIRVTMLLDRFPPMPRIVIDGLCLLLALVYVGFVTYGGSIVAYEMTLAGEHETGLINFPMWPGRIGLAFGLLILCTQYVIEIIRISRSPFTK